MPGDRPALRRPKPQGSTRIGNFKQLLVGVDGRSTAARCFKEVAAALVDDLGGDPSEAQLALIRRAATLSAWCEQAEAALARGGDFDLPVYATAVNTLHRLLHSLGWHRTPKDVTPALAAYLAERSPPDHNDEDRPG